jgi:hypothetical protein
VTAKDGGEGMFRLLKDGKAQILWNQAPCIVILGHMSMYSPYSQVQTRSS